MTDRPMACAMCGRKKSRDGFPMASIYAECWECVWERHCRVQHKPRRKLYIRWPFYRDPLDAAQKADRVEQNDPVVVGGGWPCTGAPNCPCPGLHGSGV